ncbi:hypothetical protein KIH87_02935 [Paraneptunicella aestuarii]|uniref:hypothetical protein n=1 Tax=Paraneptunicella aestuarii TaxID=2831148 RepID=UPI001E290A48|nr:hypothetical protein [Paraneptunicella aestuarii]UAA39336.1 hypothetical protein KIH87_02935 [Paraneptunicella aestuarii]
MIRSSLLLLSTLLLASQASAEVECYDLPNGVNGQGSKNTVRLPSISGAWASENDLQLTLRNMSDINLNFKIKFYNANAQPFVPSNQLLSGNFSTSNNPVADSSGSGYGFLRPENIGVVRVENTTSTYTAELTWYADQCLVDPGPIVSVIAEHTFKKNSTYFNTLIPVNSGNAF